MKCLKLSAHNVSCNVWADVCDDPVLLTEIASGMGMARPAAANHIMEDEAKSLPKSARVHEPKNMK